MIPKESINEKIVDSHAHVWLKNVDQNIHDLIEALDTVPLQETWVSGLGSHEPDSEEIVNCNDAVLRLMKADARIRGFIYLNPRDSGQALDEIEKRLDQGFSGIKLWVSTLADDPLNNPVYEKAIEHSIPVLAHAFDKLSTQLPHESRPHHVASAASSWPECCFIMAHIGANFVSGCECVADCPNVAVDISGSYGENRMVDYAVNRLGHERVLFGTDMPGSDIYHNLGKVLGAEISETARSAILHGNACRIMAGRNS